MAEYEDLVIEAALADGERTVESIETMDRPYVAWSVIARGGAFCDQAADEDVEEWCECQSKERDTEHAREHRDAHDVAHLGTSAAGENERNHTHDERERRHENRPQTDAARLERGGQTV